MVKKLFYLILFAGTLFLYSGCVQKITVSGNCALGKPSFCDQVIERRGFTTGYSNLHRQPLWVSYILSAENLTGIQVKRTDKFLTDPLIKHDPVIPKEYARSGFDRGHIAPAADMAYSPETMAESFYMSNMSPQLPYCNRKSWLSVETLMRKWALKEKKLYIVAGPVFSRFFGKVPEKFRVTVPGHFFKAVLDLTPPHKMIAFVVPNSSTGGKNAESFAISVDELEKLTGYDFFDLLDDDLENKLEKQCCFEEWGE